MNKSSEVQYENETMKKVLLCVNIFTAILCYGFALTNSGIGIDDESIARGINERLPEVGRLGIKLIDIVFDIGMYLPWFYLFLCLCMLIAGNYMIFRLYHKISDKYDECTAAVFSAFVLSYPGFAYKFIFTINLLQMGLVYLAVVVIVLLNWRCIMQGERRIIYTLVLSLLYLFLLFNYETSIVFVFVLFGYAIILSMTERKYNLNELIRKAVFFFVPIILGIVLWKGIEQVYFLTTGIIKDGYTSSYITYQKGGLCEGIFALFKNLFADILNISLEKMAAVFLVIFLLMHIFFNHNKLGVKILLCLLELGSAFFMPLLTGNYFQLPRVTLYLSVFWGICACSLYMYCRNTNCKKIYIFAVLFLSVNIYYNALHVNKVIYCDYIKDERDLEVANNIYHDLQAATKNYKEKPVVFVGAIDAYSSPFDIELGIDSMFRHDIIGENLLCNRTLYVRVYAYFEMLGMQLIEGTDEDFIEAANISIGQASYPASGYIVEKDDFIVVKLGDYIPILEIDNAIVLKDSRVHVNNDTFIEDDTSVTVEGWAYMDYVTSHRVKKYIMMTDTKSNQSWILRCANILREDVVNSLQLSKGYQWAGYRLTADKAHLPEGEYKIELILNVGGSYYQGSDIGKLLVH